MSRTRPVSIKMVQQVEEPLIQNELRDFGTKDSAGPSTNLESDCMELVNEDLLDEMLEVLGATASPNTESRDDVIVPRIKPEPHQELAGPSNLHTLSNVDKEATIAATATENSKKDSSVICLSSEDEEVEVWSVNKSIVAKKKRAHQDKFGPLATSSPFNNNSNNNKDGRSVLPKVTTVQPIEYLIDDVESRSQNGSSNIDNDNADSKSFLPETRTIQPIESLTDDAEYRRQMQINFEMSKKANKSTQTDEINFPKPLHTTSTVPSEASPHLRNEDTSGLGTSENLNNQNDPRNNGPNGSRPPYMSNEANYGSYNRCGENNPQRSYLQRTMYGSGMYVRPQPYLLFHNHHPNGFPNTNNPSANPDVNNYINRRVGYLMRQYESRLLQGFVRFMNFILPNNQHNSNQNNPNNNQQNMFSTENDQGGSNFFNFSNRKKGN